MGLDGFEVLFLFFGGFLVEFAGLSGGFVSKASESRLVIFLMILQFLFGLGFQSFDVFGCFIGLFMQILKVLDLLIKLGGGTLGRM